VPNPTSLKDRVAQILAQEVAPALAMDASTLEVVEVADGIARIRLGGACGCCPTSLMTVIMGIEEELRKRVPEIEYLEAVP